MLMIKYLITFLLIFLLHTKNLNANEIDVNCDRLYYKYKLDINTKTYKGWVRVCNNNKLHIYLSGTPSEYEYTVFKDCFKNSIQKYNTSSYETIKEPK